MRWRRGKGRSGFTLLEVVVAATVILVGCLALIGGLAASAGLAGDGRRLGRSAEALSSRADLLRAAVRASAPGCVAPASGSAAAPDGIFERWRALRRDRVVDLLVETRYVRGGRLAADTLITAVECP